MCQCEQGLEETSGHSRAEERIVHPAELEAGEGTTGLEHAVGLLEDVGDGGAVADTKCDRIQVVRVWRKLGFRHVLCVRLFERNLGGCRTM